MSYLKNNPIVLAAIILALGLIIAATIQAFDNRYVVTEGIIITDKWNSTFERASRK